MVSSMLHLLYTEEGAGSTHCMGCWVSPRVALCAVEKGNISGWKINHDSSLSSVFRLVTMLMYPGCSQNCVYDEIEIVDYSYGMFTIIHVRFFCVLVCYLKA